MSTTRSCTIYVKNNWGETLTNMTMTHSMGDNNDCISVATFEKGASSYKLNISFETGSAPSYDYWHVSFTDSDGVIWHTPNNDRCNISEEQDGGTFEIGLQGKSKMLKIGIPEGCEFEITTV